MTLKQKIISIYPELEGYDFADADITLHDNGDGSGAYILKWNHPEYSKPTQEQLDAIE